MTIDFKLESWDLDGGNGITNRKGYKVKMNEITANELPLITSNVEELYMQSVAIFPTINKGQMKHYPDYGIEPKLKAYSNQPTALGVSSQYKLLEQMASMVEGLFMDNTDILEFAKYQQSEIRVKPTLEE